MRHKSSLKAPSAKNKMGSIRIIAGKYRGRKLPVIAAVGLRPTTDRVKETVFNWLMPYVNESICLDCFAGSGSLGFEALSRGAQKVTFLELNKKVARQLKQNVLMLDDHYAEVIQTDSMYYLNGDIKTFDLVFIDPPFRKGMLTDIIKQLEQGWLNNNALIYIESEVDIALSYLPIDWNLLKEKIAGQVAYRLYQYKKIG